MPTMLSMKYCYVSSYDLHFTYFFPSLSLYCSASVELSQKCRASLVHWNFFE